MTPWTDVTSWARSDDAETRKTPRTWELRIPSAGTRVCVTRHIHYPGTWVGSVDGLMSIGQQDLHTDDPDEAKSRMLSIAASAAESLRRALMEVFPDPSGKRGAP